MTAQNIVPLKRLSLGVMGLTLAALLSGCRPKDDGLRGARSNPGVEHLPCTVEELKHTAAHSPSTEVDDTLQKVKSTLDEVYAEKMPNRFPNWIVLHALLMYGPSAYEEYCSNRAADGNLNRIFSIIQNSNTEQMGPFVLRWGLLYPRHSGPRFMQQHHPDQFLYYFSMSGGPLDAKLMVDGKEYTFHNLLDSSLLEATTRSELAFTVLAYSRYLEPGSRWKSKFGKPMSLAILLEKLLRTPEPTCLGAHRLGALARVYSNERLKQDKEVAALWGELERQVLEALVRLKQSQRQDGSFTPPGLTPGTQSRDNIDIYYTGHSLEWITFLGKAYCHDDWVVHAAARVSAAVGSTHELTFKNMDALGNVESHFDFDGMCHAVSGLRRWEALTCQ